MSENPNTNQQQGEHQPAFANRIEERWERRAERRAARGGSAGGAWVGGAILIVLGIIFLLQNLNVLALNNWWALFILIPAVGSFAAAWSSYQNAGGHLTTAGRSSLIGGIILTMITAVFLFNLNWTFVGPALLILIGAGILLNGMLPK